MAQAAAAQAAQTWPALRIDGAVVVVVVVVAGVALRSPARPGRMALPEADRRLSVAPARLAWW